MGFGRQGIVIKISRCVQQITDSTVTEFGDISKTIILQFIQQILQI